MRTNFLPFFKAARAAFVVLLLAVMGLPQVKAQTFTVENLNYSINEDGATVTVTGHVDGTNATGALVIPGSVEYYNTDFVVSIIAENAFNGCSGLTGSLTIPASVTSIGASAFRGCTGFTGSLTLSNVAIIEDFTFSGCGFTGSLLIPASVTSIGANAFTGCSGFTGDLTIPNSVTFIGTDAFNGCSGFDGALTIGNSVEKTGIRVFAGCGGFTTLNYNAVDCFLMQVYDFEGGLNVVVSGEYGNAWYSEPYSLEQHWLNGCSSLTTLNIGDGVEKIPSCFLDGCSSFTGDLIIPESITEIQLKAFDGCTGFSGALTIPSNLTVLGSSAFENCNGFTALNYNAVNCEGLNASWLAGVVSLNTLNIGQGVQRIPDDFLSGMSGIMGSLTIPNSVTYIGANAFTNCSGLSGVLTLGSSLAEIGATAFYGACQSFTSINVLAEDPPMLGANVFLSADYSIPVLVPGCSSSAYQSASGWDMFTNIQEASACVREITATANPSDGGVIEGAGSYEQGSSCTLTAIPNADYAFVNWTENGEEVSADMEYTFEVNGDREMVANFRYIRYEITALATPGESGAVEGAGSYLEGETCTLTATPTGYYYFVNWTENGEEVSTDAEYSFVVTGNRSLEAHFALPTHSVAATVNPSEAGMVEFNVPTVYDFDDGTLQGWMVVDSDGDGNNWLVRSDNYGDTYDLYGHSAPCFAASFSYYSGAINPDNYLISPELSDANQISYYVAGNSAYRDHYAVFASTTGNNVNDFSLVFEETIPVGKGAEGKPKEINISDRNRNVSMTSWTERTIQLPQGTKYVAFRHYNSNDKYFVLIDDITVFLDSDVYPYGVVSSGIVYPKGETCIVTAIPNQGYAFTSWQENGEVVSIDAEYSFTVLEDRNLIAKFTPLYEVAVNAEDGGLVSGAGSYLEGATCTLTAIPNEEWAFVNWTEDGVEVSADAEYTFTVTGNRNLMAHFRNLRHSIEIVVRPWAGGVVNAAEADVEEVMVSQTYDFENGIQGWISIDADGDGRTWMINSQWNASVLGHNGSSDFVMSESYNNAVLYPDNYLVSPQIKLGGSITFFASAQDTDWSAEHFGVAVSTTGPNTSDFTTIQEWTISAKDVGAPTEGTRSGNRGGQGTWYQYTVDLSDYAGIGYVAIRHFNCSDMWHLNVDDITITYPDSHVSYLEGETCTLTATPNNGWVFFNWSENGEVISTDPGYSFTVETDRTLLVRFKNPNTIDFVDSKVESICVAHWDTDGDGFISYEEAAAVTDLGNAFQGNAEISSFGELQYFTGLTSIADNAFNGCSSLVSVTLPEGITAIGSGAFQDCVNLTGDLVIPNAVVTIGDHAYRECAALTSLTIGNAVTSIGHNAFYHCYGMSGELTIPNSVETIGVGVFIDCGFTGTLTLGSGLTSIGNASFRRLNVNEVHWNAVNCTYAGDNWDAPIFSECNNLSALVFSDDVVTIPEYAFLNCSSLTGELILPSSLTYIGGCAFYGCQSFTGSLVIPDSVEYIGWESFSNTGFNGTLTIGQSVSQIDGGAFDYTGFTSLDYNAINCSYIENAYMNDNASVFYGINTVVLGENVETLPSRAFRGCDSFTGTLALPNSLKTIGDQAFINCYGFDGIVMGNSIETIGSEAFRNCGGLRGELTLPETLQSIGAYAFAGCDEINTVNYNAINCGEMGNAQQPVFFDCASIEHINIGSAVESIPNYAFKRCTNVADIHTAAVVPPVIQASTFAAVPRSIPVLVPSGSGDSYRNAQYWEEFFNIMEDGEQYSFYWEVNTHQYAHNLSVIGIVQINGEEQTSSAIEIGAFCGDECRGRQLLTAYPDLNRSLVFLTVFGEEGDLITFRLYDHETEEESSLACATVLTFEADAIVGAYNDPEVLNFVEMQNAALEAGWTWFCAYVDADGGNLLQMMEESLGESGVMIKSHADGFLSYDEYGWDGTLATLNLESMYMVNASAPAVVSLSGAFANVAEHPVTLSPEWNWIGYPSYKAASLNNALEGFNAQDGDVIKMQEAFSQYIEGIGWTGALKTLVPGEGLMYHSLNGSETTLTYTVNAKDDAVEKNLTGEDNHWTPNRKAYPFNMSVVAVVELDGVEAADGRYELAAFDGDECRGSVRLMQVGAIDRYMAFLTVSGNDDTELRWALYDTETGETYRDDAAGFHFEQNALLGSVKEPLTVRFANLTGADETYDKVLCYPNPVGRSQYVRVNLPAVRVDAQVDILNALGAVVSSQRVNDTIAEVKAPKAAGIYVMRVAIDGKNVAYTKLIVD